MRRKIARALRKIANRVDPAVQTHSIDEVFDAINRLWDARGGPVHINTINVNRPGDAAAYGMRLANDTLRSMR
ncbi:Uncharacterised protein [Mycobacteroides abscessus subsp. abscessus]|uniref:hypothetical protein n=1 Tax=Mycobacteroides abscessus TaxID=36809 RepID=UPI0009285CBB|nr:hypothetical protein [Mycobacteroides abscessus]SIC56014.1 Uncharacterised protein [Mycobacteroides abscessus subsp. abscessus]SKU57921.1 Uncharacterised protein [Mycobacteroides abscessus subsp. abscessus]